MHDVDSRTAALLSHLHRGGSYAFWWTAPDKRSHWWEVGNRAPVPNGHRNTYFGVHPVRSIPLTNSEGMERPPEAVRSQIAYIAAINCLYAEFDFKAFISAAVARDHVDELLPPPSVVIHSGGGLHCYWLLVQPYLLDTDTRRERAQHAQADFVVRVGADTGAKDLARVLRLPGTRNYKPVYAPDYPEVCYLKCDLDLAYMLDDLVSRRQPKTVVPFSAQTDTDEAAKAKRALDRLSASRREEYADWLAVGMSLRKLGTEGLQLWEAWSSGSAKYHTGECESKWRTFQGREEITLGSLYHWAGSDDPGGKPRKVKALDRKVKEEKNIVRVETETMSIEAAQMVIRTAIEEYLANPYPTYVLVIAAPPGIGKTTLAVEAAELQTKLDRRVLYCAPRRNFWQDIATVSHKLHTSEPDYDPLSLWYPWIGRTTPDENGHTLCLYPEAMDAWLARGWGAIKLCSNTKFCGWKVVNSKGAGGCKYHQQKHTQAPIIFCQHAHAVLGHPLLETCHVLIGDENPRDAFLHKWHIPTAFIVPKSAPYDEPMTELLTELQKQCGEKPISGTALIDTLGGSQWVQDACGNPSTLPDVPNVANTSAIQKADYNHTQLVAWLLGHEAAECQAGRQYIDRVIAQKDGLTLLYGHLPNAQLPPHVIWLDATGNEDLYKELFHPRPVHIVKPTVRLRGAIHQITDRSNGKHSLIPADDDGVQLTQRFAQLVQTIGHIANGYGQRAPYQYPALISFKDITGWNFDDVIKAPLERLHYYGARGTNSLETCDCIIIAGTPQPAMTEMIITAKMLFKRRMRAFDTTWSERDIPYNHVDQHGKEYSYPVSGFWHDDDLRALHWDLCDAEIIQAAHRARPLRRAVDIWLLTNRPMETLPPTRLWTLRELFNAPEGVDLWVWPEVMKVADAYYAANAPLTTADLMSAIGIQKAVARHYIDVLKTLVDTSGKPFWIDPPEGCILPNRGRGKPPRTIIRNGE